MYVVSGTLRETPQQTHRWNNVTLHRQQLDHLQTELAVACPGVPTTTDRFWLGLPVFHLPIFGGWKEYVVLSPSTAEQAWHVGWIAGDTAGLSQITVRGPVRMLRGPGAVTFFGVTPAGVQTPIQMIATGRIGDQGPYAASPLL